jgi:hypothetical protein
MLSLEQNPEAPSAYQTTMPPRWGGCIALFATKASTILNPAGKGLSFCGAEIAVTGSAPKF